MNWKIDTFTLVGRVNNPITAICLHTIKEATVSYIKKCLHPSIQNGIGGVVTKLQ